MAERNYRRDDNIRQTGRYAYIDGSTVRKLQTLSLIHIYRSDADCDHIEDTKDKDGQSNRQIRSGD